MLKRGQKVLVTKFVRDKRCTGDDHAAVHLVYEGDLCYQAQQANIAIVHHVVFRSFELVVFVPGSPREVWTRYYFSRDALFQKLKPEDMSRFMAEELEYSRRHRRHYSPEAADRAAKYDGVKNVIVEIIPELLKYDAARRFVDVGGDSIHHDILNEKITTQSYDYKPVTMIMSKPERLVPVNVDPALIDSSYDIYLRSDRERKLISIGINRVSRVLTSKFQPLSTGRKNERFTATSSAGVRRSNSIYANIRSSLHRITAIFQSHTNAVVPCDDSTSTADSSEVSPTKQDSLVQLHSKKKPVTSGLMSSLVQRQISFFRAAIGVVSSSKKDRDEDVSAPIYVSYARFRWLKAVDKVITRNTTQYYRQLLLRQSMMVQLKRVIMRQRSDFAMMIRDGADISTGPQLPTLMLPRTQFSCAEQSTLTSESSASGVRIQGRLKSDLTLSRPQNLSIDTSTTNVPKTSMSSIKSFRMTATTPTDSFRVLSQQSKFTPQAARTPLASYRQAGTPNTMTPTRTSPPTPSRILARDSPLRKHASGFFQ